MAQNLTLPILLGVAGVGLLYAFGRSKKAEASVPAMPDAVPAGPLQKGVNTGAPPATPEEAVVFYLRLPRYDMGAEPCSAGPTVTVKDGSSSPIFAQCRLVLLPITAPNSNILAKIQTYPARGYEVYVSPEALGVFPPASFDFFVRQPTSTTPVPKGYRQLV